MRKEHLCHFLKLKELFDKSVVNFDRFSENVFGSIKDTMEIADQLKNSNKIQEMQRDCHIFISRINKLKLTVDGFILSFKEADLFFSQSTINGLEAENWLDKCSEVLIQFSDQTSDCQKHLRESCKKWNKIQNKMLKEVEE